MRRLAIAALALVLLRGDMYQDARNAELPAALYNLGAMSRDGSNADNPEAINNLTKGAGTYFATAYGTCTWDAMHDVSACINAAGDAAKAGGGGTVIVPAGSFGISAAVDLKQQARVEGAGGGDAGVCATKLTAIGGYTGPMVTAGDGTVGTLVADTGLKRLCLDGGGTATIGVKLRSVRWSTFEDIMIWRVTQAGWDVDVAAGGSPSPNIFLHFTRTYVDLSDASAVNAKGWVVGASYGGQDTQRSVWLDNTVHYNTGGEGFVCGFMDSNAGYAWHIEPVGSGTGASLRIKGGTMAATNVCQNNVFEGEFGANLVGGPQVESATYPPYANKIQQNRSSGAPGPVVAAGASVAWSSVDGYRFEPKWVRPIVVASFPVGLQENGTVFSNTGAAFGTTAVLPAAKAGDHYCFHADGHTWSLTAAAGNTIKNGATTSPAGGTVATAADAYACVNAYAAGKWVMH